MTEATAQAGAPSGAPSSSDGGTPGAAPSNGAQSAPAFSNDQMQAHGALQSLRAEMIRPDGSTNVEAKTKFAEANAYLYGHGPKPAWLDAKAPPTAEELAQPAYDPATGFPRDEIANTFYQPAERADDYHFANVPQTASREAVGEIKSAMHSLGVSRADGAKLFEEFTRLQGLQPTAEHQSALEDILAQSWGDRYDENVALAQKAWGRMPAALKQDIETNFPGFMLSPWVFQILARAERAHEMRGR